MGITETKIRDSKFSSFNPEIYLDIILNLFPNHWLQIGWVCTLGTICVIQFLKIVPIMLFKLFGLKFKSVNYLWFLYRQPNSPESFQNYFEDTLHKFAASSSNKSIYIMGDFNIDLLKAQACHFAQNFLFTLQSYALTPTKDKPTKIHNSSSCHTNRQYFC